MTTENSSPFADPFNACLRLRELAERQTLTWADRDDLNTIADRLHSLAARVSRIDTRYEDTAERLSNAEKRMHLILNVIYDGISHRDLATEAQQAAKLRQIERLARLDWDDDGMSRVV